MIETTWQPAPPSAYPIVAYLVFESELAVTSGKEQYTGTRRPYTLKLPYTSEQLIRRQEREWEAV